ncbi:MAG: PD40 domain-containing protein [Polyangiaceae bacterium]|nr:PD40 domain-containing protein [Polyangiaceae bacterium]
MWHSTVSLPVFGLLLLAALGCTEKEATEPVSFYDRRIQPILQSSCASSPTQSGCHVGFDDRGNAFGNLSVESFEDVSLRRDLLETYGPYGVPALLLKVVPSQPVRLTSWDDSEPLIIDTDIAHAGGSLMDITSSSFTQIQRWIDRGATASNTVPAAADLAATPCVATLGAGEGFDSSVDPSAADFATFRSEVSGVLSSSCVAGNCHGAVANSLYLTCGDTAEQERWNYYAVRDYVSSETHSSEILRRALSQIAGGSFHEGGAIYQTTNDPGYRSIERWAAEKGGPSNVPTDPGFVFFAERVQPVLVKKGCMQLGCHSPSIFHDYRLRGGSGGHFGLPAALKNYDLSLEQISLSSPDPNASRLIRKNLAPRFGGGIRHRGGPLLAGSVLADCDMEAAATGPVNDQDPYCVIAAWIELERQELMSGELPLSAVVYVSRATLPSADTPQDFESFSAGADLVRASAAIDPLDGWITLSDTASLLGPCGLDFATVDLRRPQVSWDGTRIAFAARTAASAPWQIYVSDDTGCSAESAINAAPVDVNGASIPANGELIHNFDPAFAPDGRIVFASTRGNVMNTSGFSYSGPQRSPANPSRLNANLYISESGGIRQLTFLLNQELLPSFMSDGRLIFTTEKRAPKFYQLAGRRINLDGGDYHPLFGQRSTIGYSQLTDVVELSDKNLAAIFSEQGAAHGAGAIAIVNRSLGIDQQSTDPADYTQDPTAIDWPNPDFYQHSISMPDPAASGRLESTNGAYRNPSPLPNGRILVSYAAAETDLSTVTTPFGLVALDPTSGERRSLVAGGPNIVWPVAVYARANHGIFTSRPDEPNGVTRISTADAMQDRAEITFLDLPLLTSLMFQNTRTGRDIASNPQLEIWESLPPAAGVTDYASGGNFVVQDDFGSVYVRRRLLGKPTLSLDGSSRVQVPGGVPLVYSANVRLAGDSAPTRHFLREELQFYPGEMTRQSFPRSMFNGLCGGCHGSVSGMENEISVNPDILTSASNVSAASLLPTEILDRNGAVQGPPFP